MRNIFRQKKMEKFILSELQFYFQRSVIHLQIHSNLLPNCTFFHTCSKSSYYPELNKITWLLFYFLKKKIIHFIQQILILVSHSSILP